MGKWLRKDALCRQHAKFVQAGFWGATVTEAAWEIAKAFDCPNGDITKFWSWSYLARWLQLEGEDLDRIANGMRAAQEAGLIDRDGDTYRVHDWAEHQPETSTERVRRFRSVKRDETVSCVSGNAETTHGTGQDRTGQDTSQSVSPKPQTPEPESECYSVADALAEVVFGHNPKHRDKRSYQVAARAAWANSLLQLHAEGVGWQDMRTALGWLAGSNFWLGVVTDGASFVHNWSKLEAKRLAEESRKKADPTIAAEAAADRERKASRQRLADQEAARKRAAPPPADLKSLVRGLAADKGLPT